MKQLLILALVGAAGAAHAGDTYQLDAAHTFAQFEWDHFGLAKHTGKFNTTTGTIAIDPAAKTGSVDVVIDATSVNTGVVKLDEHLKSPDFFDVARFPTITFKSTAFRFEGTTLAAVEGNLTVHGVTKPVTLAITRFVCKDHPMKKTPACGADAMATIKRSEFGVGMYAPAVSDDISLKIEVEALKK